jgi:dCMP deaminase
MTTVSELTKYLQFASCLADIFSKDPKKKVGAVFLDPTLHILSTGVNAFPRGVNDNMVYRWTNPAKSHFVEHAERNGIYNAARQGVRLCDSLCVVTMFPCSPLLKSCFTSVT